MSLRAHCGVSEARAEPERLADLLQVPGRWLHIPGRWWVEALLILAVDQLYELVRSLAPQRVSQALANARTIEHIEAVLHIELELPLSRGLEHLHQLIPLASVYYQVGHLVALLVTLGWAWTRHRDRYAAARNALLAVSLTALLGYWLLPTAPPRFALSGTVDTVAAHPVLFADNGSVTGLVNLYAAMPSLHVAWAVWVALTVTRLSTAPRRALVWLHPALTTLVVLATANHYLIDAVAGAVLAAAAWALVHPHALRARFLGPSRASRMGPA
jgi:PAP2 superfamily